MNPHAQPKDPYTPARASAVSGSSFTGTTTARIVYVERTPESAAFDFDRDADLESQIGNRQHRGRAALKRRVKPNQESAFSRAEKDS